MSGGSTRGERGDPAGTLHGMSGESRQLGDAEYRETFYYWKRDRIGRWQEILQKPPGRETEAMKDTMLQVQENLLSAVFHHSENLLNNQERINA